MDLAGLDATWDYNFPTLRILGLHERSHRFGSGHPLMVLMIVAYPHSFLIGDPEVDSGNWPLVTTFQFPEPLVGDVEVASDWDGENAAWKVVRRAVQSTDTVPPDQGDTRGRRKMNEHCHEEFPMSANQTVQLPGPSPKIEP